MLTMRCRELNLCHSEHETFCLFLCLFVLLGKDQKGGRREAHKFEATVNFPSYNYSFLFLLIRSWQEGKKNNPILSTFPLLFSLCFGGML